MRVVALVVVLAWFTSALADAGGATLDAGAGSGGAAGIDGTGSDGAGIHEAEADAALRAAIARSQSDLAGALADLEALGARRPLTRWSDNAWSEAARLAEAAGNYTRARRALEQVIAIDRDAPMVRRARATIERLGAITGGGRWDAIARRHDELVSSIFGGGDPHAAIAELEALVRANPAYPRANAARISLARAWEMEGDTDLALTWMRTASDQAGQAERGQRTRLELARMAIRMNELDAARAELHALSSIASTDRAALADARSNLATAERRRWIRRAVWALLALLAIAALTTLARDTGAMAQAKAADSVAGSDAVARTFDWRAAMRRLARPPIEVWFLLPLSGVVAGVAATQNPLAARAIISIAIAGLGVAWTSGVLVDVARERRALGRGRLAVHLACVAVAVAGIVFLAVERGGVIHLLLETWRGGHALR